MRAALYRDMGKAAEAGAVGKVIVTP